MFAEVRCDGLHLLADGRVVVGQVAMVAARVDHAQRIALRGEIAGNRLHLRVLLFEIDRHHAADRRGHLIHQAARLAEIDVLHLLRDDGAWVLASTTKPLYSPSRIAAISTSNAAEEDRPLPRSTELEIVARKPPIL